MGRDSANESYFGTELEDTLHRRQGEGVELSLVGSGHIFVLDGAAAAGKTSVAKRLVEDEPLSMCPRMTTREPRPGDQEYEFISDEEFERMTRDNEFAAYRVFLYGASYGVSRARVEELLGEGKNVLIVVDLGTADQVKQVWPEAVTIFIIAPLEHIQRRLNQDPDLNERQISEKVQNAANTLALAPSYDYVIPNRDGEQEKAYAQVRAIIQNQLAS